jgi:hypothetical protein
MADDGDGLSYAPTIEFHRSKKLDKITEYFKRLDKIKELATEKLRDVKDIIENNKRQTVYIVATVGSGIACYAITGDLRAGLAGSMVSSGFSIAHNELQEK